MEHASSFSGNSSVSMSEECHGSINDDVERIMKRLDEVIQVILTGTVVHFDNNMIIFCSRVRSSSSHIFSCLMMPLFHVILLAVVLVFTITSDTSVH